MESVQSTEQTKKISTISTDLCNDDVANDKKEDIVQKRGSRKLQYSHSSIRFQENSANEKSEKRGSFKTKRESSQLEIFLHQFIKPEIKEVTPIANQRLNRRTSKRQANINVMIIGEPGLGKKTFIQSIVNGNTIKKDESRNIADEATNIIGNGLIETTYNLIKDGQKVCLKLIQVPEYGCGMQSDASFKDILEYVDGTFKECFKLECSLNRTSTEDRKIHCCLYFISSFGHGLKPLDIAFMKKFQTKFNIIPVIAKADIFTSTEIINFKSKIQKEMEDNKINIFEHSSNSECSDDNVGTVEDFGEDLKNKIPLSIISFDEKIINNLGKEDRVRSYPWGNCKTTDSEISNYNFLENVLLKSHINYFKTITKSVHYEKYRVEYILEHVK